MRAAGASSLGAAAGGAARSSGLPRLQPLPHPSRTAAGYSCHAGRRLVNGSRRKPSEKPAHGSAPAPAPHSPSGGRSLGTEGGREKETSQRGAQPTTSATSAGSRPRTLPLPGPHPPERALAQAPRPPWGTPLRSAVPPPLAGLRKLKWGSTGRTVAEERGKAGPTCSVASWRCCVRRPGQGGGGGGAHACRRRDAPCAAVLPLGSFFSSSKDVAAWSHRGRESIPDVLHPPRGVGNQELMEERK
ncbi:uncharacterized protein LOC125641790 [Caretta caretta]|uniref:uncharacterized protein LOC125641790 n=1 Tax=Caretta caretta TaxID=8467 RepID=UPI003F4C1B75